MSLADFDPVARFVAGTVGPPGQRVFFLQARGGHGLVSVSLEKQQVSVLAERVEELLDRVGDKAPADRPDNEPLDTPIEDEFRVGTIGLAWEPARGRVVIECHDHDPDEGPPPPDAALHSVRVVLTTGQAREFVRRSGSLVAAGRPPCPFCGLPLDVTGHICPRANGYRR